MDEGDFEIDIEHMMREETRKSAEHLETLKRKSNAVTQRNSHAELTTDQTITEIKRLDGRIEEAQNDYQSMTKKLDCYGDTMK